MSKKKETRHEPTQTKNKIYVIRIVDRFVCGHAFLEDEWRFPGFREIGYSCSSSGGLAWFDVIKSWETYKQHFPQPIDSVEEIWAERPDFAFVDMGIFPEGHGREWRNVLDALWDAADEWRDKLVDRFDPAELKKYW